MSAQPAAIIQKMPILAIKNLYRSNPSDKMQS